MKGDSAVALALSSDGRDGYDLKVGLVPHSLLGAQWVEALKRLGQWLVTQSTCLASPQPQFNPQSSCKTLNAASNASAGQAETTSRTW